MHKVILFHLGSKGKATEKNKILPPIFVNPSRPPKKANILQFKRAVKARGRIASQSPPLQKENYYLLNHFLTLRIYYFWGWEKFNSINRSLSVRRALKTMVFRVVLFPQTTNVLALLATLTLRIYYFWGWKNIYIIE